MARFFRKWAVFAPALALLAAFSACSVKPAAVPVEDRITQIQPPAPQSQSRSQASSSEEQAPALSRPINPEYELLTFDGAGITGQEGRKMVFEMLPGGNAANVVCNAFSAEVTGEFWRWAFLCQTPIREPALALPWLDALEQGYTEGFGYQTITVNQVYELTAQQLYTTMDGRGENLILWPQFQQAGNAASYEANVDEFLRQGDCVVYLDCTLEYTPAQAAQSGADSEQLSAWYYLEIGDNGRLWITNSTFYTGGRFIA